ncbi:MAG: alcohol dehydrogenase catalytic domain-containing protein, partial [Candidatus Latescibacterota bacterium]
MKSFVYQEYGPPHVLQLKEVQKPVPKNDEVLIKIHATTVTIGDVHMRRFKFPFMYWLPSRIVFGLTKPRNTTLGFELAGKIESVGSDVKRFARGDPIFGTTGFKSGAYAEYICLREDGMMAIKPANATYEDAAAGV